MFLGKSWFNYDIERNSEYFEEYLALIELKVKEDSDRLEEMQRDIEKSEIKRNPATEDYRYDARDYLVDKAYERDEFQQLMYKSFVISVFVFMEGIANDVCNYVQQERKEVFNFKDMREIGIGGAIKYLHKLLGKHPLVHDATRKEFEVAWKIRNALVHADGMLKKDNLSLIEDFIEKNPKSLRIGSASRISLTYSYVESLLLLSSRFSKELGTHFEDQPNTW